MMGCGTLTEQMSLLTESSESQSGILLSLHCRHDRLEEAELNSMNRVNCYPKQTINSQLNAMRCQLKCAGKTGKL